MADGITMRIDSREFDAAWRQYLKVTSKTYVQAINQKSLDIVFEALKRTPRAVRAEIMALGTSVITHGKRGGLLKRARTVIRTHGRMRAIVVANLRREGKLASTTGVSAIVKKELGNRLKGIGYLASGWIPSIRKFLRKLGRGGANTGGVRQFGRAKGRATPAKEGRPDPRATFENNVTPLLIGGAISTRATGHMTRAFQEAFNHVARNMAQHLARKMQKDANRFNAR